MEDYKIKKLNGDNYHAWAIRARAFMVQKRCWEAVDPGYGTQMTDNERRKNDEALTLMFLIVEDTFLDDIGDCLRAKEAWDSLKDMHTKYGLLHVLQLMKDFFNIVMNPGETIQSYLARLMEIHRKLSNGGYAFTDREVALVMLIGLPKSYENLILNLEKDEATLTTTVVKSKLLIEEKRISRNSISSDNQEEHALHVKGHTQKKLPQENSTKRWQPKKTFEPNNSSMKKHTKCFSCGEWGHISRNCEEARKRGQTMAKTAIDVKTNWALLANLREESDSSPWILDSGATEHMTSDRKKFTNLKSYKSVVEVANSEKVEVTGTGDVTLSVHGNTEEKGNITLANVLYVPELGGNLLSIGRIEERGFKIEFADGVAKILSKNNEVVLEAKRRGRLYIVEEKPPVAYITKAATDELWHRRLGHPCQKPLKDIGQSSKTRPPHLTNQPCSICIQSKMKRKRFPKCSNTKAKEVLEIIHSDVVGKITPPSLGGSNYFVVFIDDFSRHTTVYPMKTKSEVPEKFHEYRCMVEKLHNKNIKILRSDNGGEFKSNDFNLYLTQQGIRRQLSVPESPQQNGVAERTIQTLINITRCLLLESGADPKFWAEAVNTASYLHNRRASTAIDGNLPEELWLGKEVDLNHLKVFGCRTWSHVRAFHRRSKLEPRATECILAGYPDGTKGYKLWDLKERKFVISRDVIFEENVFPLKLQQHQQNENEDNVVLNIENEERISDVETGVESEQDEHQEQDHIECPQQHISHLDETPSNDLSDHHHQRADEAEACSEEETEQLEEPENSPKTSTYNKKTSTRTIKVPEKLSDYFLYNVEEKLPLNPKEIFKDPLTVKEALASPEADLWQKAMDEEVGNLRRAQTWDLVSKPPGTKLITSRWIFRKKKTETGNTKFKARLVAKGYMQVPGINFKETFSPVIKLKSIRLLIAIAVEMDLKIHQMDITSAYLNGVLEEDIFMIQPEGCLEEGKEHLVCHLKKSLYGLKQSGRVWNTCLDEYMTEYGLKRAIADPCIYYNLQKGIIVGVYVDDLLILGKIEAINAFKEDIKKKFVAKDLGPANQILSMKITEEDDGSISLDQTSYIKEVLETYKMDEAKSAATPLDINLRYPITKGVQSETSRDTKYPYRQAIGSLLYLSCGTRPDLAHATTFMSQFNEKHDENHWRGVKHILRYLKGTQNRKLRFRKTGKGVKIYSDADWGGDRVDRKSFSGYMILIAGAPVSWSSKKQPVVALSSTESEYVAMCHTAKEVLWINNLLSEICANLVSNPQSICVDNQGAIFMANNHVVSERSKHIDIKYYFLRDLLDNKVVKFEHVKSEENIADILTKQVTKQTLVKLNYGMTFT